jgi:translation initiation factor 2B subunit (eIF-2B alpha/beta/delta family)
MKYAIEQLRRNAANYNTSKHLKDLANDCKNASNYLEDKKFNHFTVGFMIAELSEIKAAIVSGLNGWGDNYPEQKKRQEKKLKEVTEAIEKLKNY